MSFWGIGPNKSALGDYLYQLRKALKMSPQELADKAAVIDRKSIERWENGETLPKRDKLDAYLTALEATPLQWEAAYRLAGDFKELARLQSSEQLGWSLLPGDLIRAARRARGLSVTGLAKKIDIEVPKISQYENNRRLPDVQTSKKLEQLLGVWLYREENVPDVLNREEWDNHLNAIELRMLRDPRSFIGSNMLPVTMDRLLMFASFAPYDQEPLLRLLRLWAGWADNQGNFELVEQISGRMVAMPIKKIARRSTERPDSLAIYVERLRGRLYLMQMYMHQHLFHEAERQWEVASERFPKAYFDGDLALRIQIARDASRLYRDVGNTTAACRKAEDAYHLAEISNSQKIVDICAMNWAHILTSSQYVPRETANTALNLLPNLPPATVSDPTRSTYLIGHAKVLINIGAWQDAVPYLTQARVIATRCNLQHRLRQIDEFAERAPRPRVNRD